MSHYAETAQSMCKTEKAFLSVEHCTSTKWGLHQNSGLEEVVILVTVNIGNAMRISPMILSA